ncbi:MAG: hypothetical protein Q8N17_15185 [Burkholderiaceae bacterium]|nr:hypothetical protein [Burkholderiaceae bacterium]
MRERRFHGIVRGADFPRQRKLAQMMACGEVLAPRQRDDFARNALLQRSEVDERLSHGSGKTAKQIRIATALHIIAILCNDMPAPA